MTTAYTTSSADTLPVQLMIMHDVVVSEVVAHVADGHVTAIDHAGQREANERRWLAVFIDQSIMCIMLRGIRGHVDSS